MDLAAELGRLGVRPIEGVFVPLSAVDFIELERRLGSPLPDDYAVYLRRFGRAGFTDGVIVGAPRGVAVILDVLFGGPIAGRVDDVFRGLEDLEDVLSVTEMVIGDDLLGNPLVLDVVTGVVSSVDLHAGSGRIEVAESFTELLVSARRDGE